MKKIVHTAGIDLKDAVSVCNGALHNGECNAPLLTVTHRCSASVCRDKQLLLYIILNSLNCY
jgi:hypothetical protein